MSTVLRKKADDLRLQVFKLIANAGGGHFGGSLSSIEILTALYYKVMHYSKAMMNDPARDRFILAKGHAGPPLYAILADIGCIDKGRLPELDQSGGSLPKHVDRLKVEGIEYSSGPLGQGLSVACGMAAGLRNEYPDTRVYALLGDGECDEGQVWEAAMTAAHHKLDKLTAIVDYNKCQIDGRSEDVMELEPFADKWRAFGWNVLECNGHDMDALLVSFEEAKQTKGKPTVIIAHTQKGKGVSFMEDNYLWHSGKVTAEQYKTGVKDLGGE